MTRQDVQVQYSCLRNKVVIVTGGATGIGADIVRAFSNQSCRVAFIDIQKEAGELLMDDCNSNGFNVSFYLCDIGHIPDLQQVIYQIEKDLGFASILINNAADDTRSKSADLSADVWDQSMAINLRPHFFTSQAICKGMTSLGGGAIINISSVVWHMGAIDLPHYAAAKAGIIGLTRSLGREFGKYNIRVNAIEPGAVMTKRQRKLWWTKQSKIDEVVARQAIGKSLSGKDVASAALFLASEQASMITAQTLTVDAGLS